MKEKSIFEKLNQNGGEHVEDLVINDYVDYIGTINDKEESAPKEVTRFLKDHNVDNKYLGADGFLAARCHVISYGYK